MRVLSTAGADCEKEVPFPQPTGVALWSDCVFSDDLPLRSGSLSAARRATRNGARTLF
jgi:hypothetical protein